jgi:hypothetical protein
MRSFMPMAWPEYQIKVETASTLMIGMIKPMRMPNVRPPLLPLRS